MYAFFHDILPAYHNVQFEEHFRMARATFEVSLRSLILVKILSCNGEFLTGFTIGNWAKRQYYGKGDSQRITTTFQAPSYYMVACK
jgi:hypothetical protein